MAIPGQEHENIDWISITYSRIWTIIPLLLIIEVCISLFNIHRINLIRPPIYNIHSISYHYLGYADSSRVVPTKTGVITDAKIVYDYVRDLAGESTPIIVHGHSLGAAVSTQAVAEMCREAGGINGDHRRLPAGYELYWMYLMIVYSQNTWGLLTLYSNHIISL